MTNIRILDIRGKIYLSQTIEYGQQEAEVNISNLINGTYVVEIDNEIELLVIER